MLQEPLIVQPAVASTDLVAGTLLDAAGTLSAVTLNNAFRGGRPMLAPALVVLAAIPVSDGAESAAAAY